MAAVENFAATPNTQTCALTTANTALDGSGSLVTAFTPGSNGSLAYSMQISAIATTNAGLIRVFYHDGTNARLMKTVEVLGVTSSSTALPFQTEIDLRDSAGQPLTLESTHSLRLVTTVTQSFHVTTIGADF